MGEEGIEEIEIKRRKRKKEDERMGERCLGSIDELKKVEVKNVINDRWRKIEEFEKNEEGNKNCILVEIEIKKRIVNKMKWKEVVWNGGKMRSKKRNYVRCWGMVNWSKSELKKGIIIMKKILMDWRLKEVGKRKKENRKGRVKELKKVKEERKDEIGWDEISDSGSENGNGDDDNESDDDNEIEEWNKIRRKEEEISEGKYRG